MKTRFLFFSILCSLVMGITITSCSKDDEPGKDKPDIVDPSKPTDDPANTVTVNLLQGSSSSNSTDLGSGISVYIDAAYNICGGNSDTQLIDIGAVAGLGNIVSIPTEGWKKNAAAIVGHGYVLKSQYYSYSNPVYARLYIESALMSDMGSVMGYTVKYQCPMELPIKLSATSVTLSSEGAPLSEIEITAGTNIQVKESPAWTTVSIENNMLIITGQQNMSSSKRTGTIILSNYSGDVEITVTQEGGEDIYAGGSGTVEDPFQIATAKQLDNVRLSPDSYFIQTADIDLSKYIDEFGNGWEPIPSLYGGYDGNFKTISGLWINRPTTSNIALFATATNGTFQHIILKLDKRGIIGDAYVAALCASPSKNSVFSQCSVEGNISGNEYVCGIGRDGQFSECRMLGNISGIHNYGYYTCGISVEGDVSNCYVVGDIVTLGYYLYAFTTKTATNSYIIAGSNSEVSNYAGRSATHCYGLKESEEAMKKKSTFEGWNFTTIWEIKEGISYPTLRCFK